MAKVLVLRGSKVKTSGGLTKNSLVRNARGKVVSKRASAHGKHMFSRIQGWVDSMMEARKALHLEGFVAINGKSLAGKAMYVKAKELYSTRTDASAALPSAACSKMEK